jgi:hypothetical protein
MVAAKDWVKTSCNVTPTNVVGEPRAYELSNTGPISMNFCAVRPVSDVSSVAVAWVLSVHEA